MTLLRVEDLVVTLPSPEGTVRAVDGVSFAVGAGDTLGVVGESGSGKSVTALTLIGLTRRLGATISGRVLWDGEDLVAASEARLRAIRGAEVAFVFQGSALDPLMRVGTQVVEAIRAHGGVGRRAARQRTRELLADVGLEPGVGRLHPHELSGGMRQRAMIAIALAQDPRLLVADEPTSALDVTVAARILELLARLSAQRGMAVILISHDLSVVARLADHTAVMYAGRIVEMAQTARVLAAPQHPYTWGLLGSIPRVGRPLAPIPGAPPDPRALPPGCAFEPRCAFRLPSCALTRPPLVFEDRHELACLLSPAQRSQLRPPL